MSGAQRDEGEVYWDVYLSARVRVDPDHSTINPDGQMSVVLVDSPAIFLDQWNGHLPEPGTVIWTRWENLKQVTVN